MTTKRKVTAVSLGVMARAPIPGRCKTRLAKTIGAQAAARIYSAMLADRIAAVDALPAARRVVVAAPEDDGVAALRRLLPSGWEIVIQRGEGLGARLGHAFEDLVRGDELVCLVDSDSPTLSLSSLWATLESPRPPDAIVAGPCEDGGYYLIGMSSLHTGILDGIPWSTSGVMAATRRRCEELGLRLDELPVGHDVDEAADIERVERELRREPGLAPRTAAVLAAIARERLAGGPLR